MTGGNRLGYNAHGWLKPYYGEGVEVKNSKWHKEDIGELKPRDFVKVTVVSGIIIFQALGSERG